MSTADNGFFFFGTLMDPSVVELVTGQPAPAMTPASACGVRRERIRGRSYPMLRPHPTGRVEGVVADGLDAVALWRLACYEGPEYYTGLLDVVMADGTKRRVMAYFCHPWVVSSRRGWQLRDWQLRARPNYMRLLAGRMHSPAAVIAARHAAKGIPPVRWRWARGS